MAEGEDHAGGRFELPTAGEPSVLLYIGALPNSIDDRGRPETVRDFARFAASPFTFDNVTHKHVLKQTFAPLHGRSAVWTSYAYDRKGVKMRAQVVDFHAIWDREDLKYSFEYDAPEQVWQRYENVFRTALSSFRSSCPSQGE